MCTVGPIRPDISFEIVGAFPRLRPMAILCARGATFKEVLNLLVAVLNF